MSPQINEVQNNKEIQFKGLPITEGVALGKILKIEPLENLIENESCADTQSELQRFQSALTEVQSETVKLSKNNKLGVSEKKIFEAHLMMLEDPEFLEQIQAHIQNDRWKATKAVSSVAQVFAEMMRAIPDPYMQERALDIKDISERILRTMTGQKLTQIDASHPCILVLKDITPSQVVQLHGAAILGVLTESGGATSHSAILLRSFDIPSVFGVSDLMKNAHTQNTVAFDGAEGSIWLNPTEATLQNFKIKVQKDTERKAEKIALKKMTSETLDGHRVYLYANLGNPTEFALLDDTPLDGVGLFRTEFLFMDRVTAPSEDEQFEVYKQLLQKTNGKKTIIRTLDIGGDKQLPYLNIPIEENPFLGLRGLRYCLEDVELFKTQLRALLRAAEFGNLYIMYPMVTEPEEVMKAQVLLEKEKETLESKLNKKIPMPKIGVMIEIPAAAIMVESFMPYVDFLSLGTNDLIQYTCAADRMNPKVKSLYHHYHPAILNLIQHVSEKAKQYKKELSICGEMGGDAELTPYLLAIGINHLSMSVARSSKVKKKLRSLNYKDLQSYLKTLIALPLAEKVREFIKQTNQ